MRGGSCDLPPRRSCTCLLAAGKAGGAGERREESLRWGHVTSPAPSPSPPPVPPAAETGKRSRLGGLVAPAAAAPEGEGKGEASGAAAARRPRGRDALGGRCAPCFSGGALSRGGASMWRGQAQFEETRQQLQKQPGVGQWKPLAPASRGQELQQPEPPVKGLGGGDEDQSVSQLNVSRLRSSSVEIREKGSEFLKEELHRAQKELKLKDEECERLSKVREQLEQELEELTASLFEEAHKMVREANTKQAASEKQLREARGKIDMLQAEVTALKTLVITSTPSSPNRELHPQLQSPTKAVFRKGHGRNKSTSSPGAATATSPNSPVEPVSSEFKESGVPTLLSLLLCIVPAKAVHITYEPGWQSLAADSSLSSSLLRQVDSILFAEFQAWKESPTLDKSCSFLERIYQEDVGPCLDFTKHELSELVQAAVEQNTLTIEPVATQALPVVKVSAMECGGPKKCALSGLSRACRHRIKLGDSGNYYYISPSCRARITAVCNFFTYIRYIQQGLVRQDVELMYWEIMRLRKEMSMAKLGFYCSEM